MKTNIPVNKAISLSMMLTLGAVMANGAAAVAQSKKECARRDRMLETSTRRDPAIK